VEKIQIDTTFSLLLIEITDYINFFILLVFMLLTCDSHFINFVSCYHSIGYTGLKLAIFLTNGPKYTPNLCHLSTTFNKLYGNDSEFEAKTDIGIIVVHIRIIFENKIEYSKG